MTNVLLQNSLSLMSSYISCTAWPHGLLSNLNFPLTQLGEAQYSGTIKNQINSLILPCISLSQTVLQKKLTDGDPRVKLQRMLSHDKSMEAWRSHGLVSANTSHWHAWVIQKWRQVVCACSVDTAICSMKCFSLAGDKSDSGTYIPVLFYHQVLPHGR